MNRVALGYSIATAVFTLNSMRYYVDNRLQKRFNIPEVLDFPTVMMFGFGSGMIWPVSVPIQVYYEKKMG